MRADAGRKATDLACFSIELLVVTAPSPKIERSRVSRCRTTFIDSARVCFGIADHSDMTQHAGYVRTEWLENRMRTNPPRFAGKPKRRFVVRVKSLVIP